MSNNAAIGDPQWWHAYFADGKPNLVTVLKSRPKAVQIKAVQIKEWRRFGPPVDKQRLK